MFFLLPNSKGGIQHLVENLSLTSIKRELLSMDQVSVAVSIPKFKFRFQSKMEQVLQQVLERH